MTVIESAAEAPNQTALAEKDQPSRLTSPQESEKHRPPPDPGRAAHPGYAATHAPQPGCLTARTGDDGDRYPLPYEGMATRLFAVGPGTTVRFSCGAERDSGLLKTLRERPGGACRGWPGQEIRYPRR
ncbi:hypothetical protein GCM10017687_76380 [Streptomyces echinatus]